MREEDDEKFLNTVYEPNNFIPLLRLRHTKADRRTMAGDILISLVAITYLFIGVTEINFIASNFLLLFGLLMLA